MNNTMVTRRLAAIVIADVAGYSRLMERDDTGTFARLRSIRDEVVDPAIVSHDGRIVKTAGDGFLAEFPSALAALRASVQIQREMAKRNEGAAAEDRVDYRIGVNLGDVMADKDDIAGDGVNVASRLESLAESGGICVSASVREQVHGQMAVAFEDIGEQQVKNIERPIRAFRVEVGIEAQRTAARLPRSRRAKRWPWVAAAVAFVAIGLGFVAVIDQLSTPTVPSAPPFSIAVLPLSAASDSPADRQIADRLTQDLTTALGRWRLARVTSRGLVEEYRGKAVDARSVGRALNVRHLVEGEVEQGAEKTVVSVRAIGTSTGAQEWSDRMVFDRKLIDAEPMALLMRAYAHVRDGIHDVEMRRAVREPDATSALNLVLRGRAEWRNPRADRLKGVRDARRYYDEVLRIDPNFELALSGRLQTLHWELYENPDADATRFKAEMDELSRRAIAADSEEPLAWSYRAETLIWLKRWDEAMAANAHAQALDPAAYWLGFPWLAFAVGRPAEAIALTEREIAIDPPGEIDAAMNLCRGYLMLGKYAAAVPACEKAAALDDATWHNQALLVVAYAQNGDMQKADIAKAELLKRQPTFSIATDPVRILSEHPEYVKMLETHYYPGLRKAGIPEK